MLGIRDADHAEYDPNVATPLIALLSCEIPSRPDGAPRLFGRAGVRLSPESLASRVCRTHEIEEEFRCSYGLNPAFREALEAGGLRITGVDENGEARVAELPGHPFFLATLFLPQMSSRKSSPHPLIVAYLQAVMVAQNVY